jgi:hypothetical protein
MSYLSLADAYVICRRKLTPMSYLLLRARRNRPTPEPATRRRRAGYPAHPPPPTPDRTKPALPAASHGYGGQDRRPLGRRARHGSAPTSRTNLALTNRALTTPADRPASPADPFRPVRALTSIAPAVAGQPQPRARSGALAVPPRRAIPSPARLRHMTPAAGAAGAVTRPATRPPAISRPEATQAAAPPVADDSNQRLRPPNRHIQV